MVMQLRVGEAHCCCFAPFGPQGACRPSAGPRVITDACYQFNSIECARSFVD